MTSPEFIDRARERLAILAEPYQDKGSDYAAVVRNMASTTANVIDSVERDHQVAIETATATYRKELEHERARRETYERQLADRARADKGLEEIWRVDEHQRRVKFQGKPTSDKNYGVVFTVGQVEDLAYRCRAGGGVDDTKVTFAYGVAEVTLESPETTIVLPEAQVRTPVYNDEVKSGVRRVVVPWYVVPVLGFLVAVMGLGSLIARFS